MKFTKEQAAAAGYDTRGFEDYWAHIQKYELEGEWEIVPAGTLAGPESFALYPYGLGKDSCENRTADARKVIFVQKVDPEPWLKLGYNRDGFRSDIKGTKIPPHFEMVPPGAGNKIQDGDHYITSALYDGVPPGQIKSVKPHWVGTGIVPTTYVILRPKASSPTAEAKPAPKTRLERMALGLEPDVYVQHRQTEENRFVVSMTIKPFAPHAGIPQGKPRPGTATILGSDLSEV